MVKADAYGHGIEEVAGAAVKAGVFGLGVCSVEEAQSLLSSGIRGVPLLLFSPYPPQLVETVISYGIQPFVSSLHQLEILLSAAESMRTPVKIHLELETGLNRNGLPASALPRCASLLKSGRWVRAVGTCTHFACSETDAGSVRSQLNTFLAMVSELKRLGVDPGVLHCANSGGVLNAPESHLDMVRPGLLQFGIHPEGCRVRLPLKPVLSLYAQVLDVREVADGQSISYGATFRTQRRSRIAVIGIGYGDGYPRQLSNRGEVLFPQGRAPIVGRVCMDVTLVDVTDLSTVQTGDTATLIGSCGERSITAEDIADCIGTTRHDVTTRILPRVATEAVWARV